jgi:uncharacterized protein with GYD domain
MSKHAVLLKFTQQGLSNVSKSPARAEAFRAQASKMGAKVETLLWTAGPYDGLIVFDAPDETTAAALVLRLGQSGDMSTCMLRAFDTEEFQAVLNKNG